MASKIKNVVKVMNFHALIRVDAARRMAVRCQQMEKELYRMVDLIMNNRNLILDKNILKPREGTPTLTIYIGSDFGFCSNYNSQVNAVLEQDTEGDKILIGRKLRRQEKGVLLRMERDEYDARMGEVEEILRKGIQRRGYSAIRVVYNRYVNASEMRLDVNQIYPFQLKAEADPGDYRDDFLIEGDPEELLTSLLATYLAYQIRITAISGYASENVMRQNMTSESMKKIEEREEEELLEMRRERRQAEFSKTIESFSKKKSMNGGKRREE